MRNTFEEVSENLRNIYEKKKFMKEKEDRMRKSVCARAPQIRVKKTTNSNTQQYLDLLMVEQCWAFVVDENKKKTPDTHPKITQIFKERK